MVYCNEDSKLTLHHTEAFFLLFNLREKKKKKSGGLHF